MQTVAQELNLAETIFILQLKTQPQSVQVRIFTPAQEVPFAGHPLVGMGHVCWKNDWLKAGEVVVQTPSRTLKMVLGEDGQSAFVAPLKTLAPPQQHSTLVSALGIQGKVPQLPVQMVHTGLPYVILPLEDPAAVDALSPTYEGLKQVLEEAGWYESAALQGLSAGLYAYAPVAGVFYARMFWVETGQLLEDAATGSAATGLMWYLLHWNQLSLGASGHLIQGVKMGHPAQINYALMDGPEGPQVRIGGHSVCMAAGQWQPSAPSKL